MNNTKSNYFDKNGNYINVENLSLADIFHRGFAMGVESKPIKHSPKDNSCNRKSEESKWEI